VILLKIDLKTPVYRRFFMSSTGGQYFDKILHEAEYQD